MKLIAIIVTLFLSLTLAVAAGDATNGKTVYGKVCLGCHNRDGSPNPAIARLRNAQMKDLSSADVQNLSDSELRAVILRGKGNMPQNPHASSARRWMT